MHSVTFQDVHHLAVDTVAELDSHFKVRQSLEPEAYSISWLNQPANVEQISVCHSCCLAGLTRAVYTPPQETCRFLDRLMTTNTPVPMAWLFQGLDVLPEI